MSKNKGLRIGSYRIQPLGLTVLIVLLLIAVAAVVVFAVNPGDVKYTLFPTPSPTPSPTPAPTPTPSPSPSPTPTPAPTPRSATIRSLGEIAVQTDILKAAKTADGYDFSQMFTYVSDIMGNADYTVADVEGSMGGTVNVSGETLMHTPASIITALKDCGVDMLNLANDHSLDGNLNDLLAAIQNCKDAGMDYVGAAASADEKKQAKVVDINGIKVGFVAYTESLNGLEKKVSSDALKYGINLISKSNAKKDIQACRDAGAEVVVAYVSWGDVGKRDITDSQKEIAKALATFGADVIIGYNPHVIQPAAWFEIKNKDGEITQRTLCLFATGNLLCASREQYSDSGVIFQFTLQEKDDFSGIEVVNPVYIPTYIWQVDLEDDTTAATDGDPVPADAIPAADNADDGTADTADTTDTADTGATASIPSVFKITLDENGKETTASNSGKDDAKDASADTTTTVTDPALSGAAKFDYRVVAAGQWLESAPDGMNYTQFSRMRAVFAEAQSILGTDVASVAAE